jgi:rare lipoprotein A
LGRHDLRGDGAVIGLPLPRHVRRAAVAALGLAWACGAAASSASPIHPEIGAVQEGKATWYSDSLAGNSTASGEPYDPHELTAAHRTLPLGTRVRVTRLDGNERSVEVRINDRGPFGGHGRIIDLSRAAAEALDMIAAGVVRVRVEVLELP